MAEGPCLPEVGENAQHMSPAMIIKHDWYQTEFYVVVTILAKNVEEDNVMVKYGENTVDVTICFPDNPSYTLHLDLAHPVDALRSNHNVMASKIEVKLKKCVGIHWSKLEGSADDDADLKYPTSAPNAPDWNHVVLDDTEGDPEGEAALNELFKKIYVEGSDEVKRAMNKSFQESGGTVLSTNWDEVSSQKIDVKPPDGLEWRKWE